MCVCVYIYIYIYIYICIFLWEKEEEKEEEEEEEGEYYRKYSRDNIVNKNARPKSICGNIQGRCRVDLHGGSIIIMYRKRGIKLRISKCNYK